MFKSINGGLLPERATKYSCGFDVFANEDVIIGAGETKLIGLGIALDGEILNIGGYDWFYANDGTEIEDNTSLTAHDHYFALHIRSSLRAKGLTSLGTGIIDIDFMHEIKMVVHNPIVAVDVERGCNIEKGVGFEGEYAIKKGDKIGQLILCRHEGWLLPSEYTKDAERTGGFGSTGK